MNHDESKIQAQIVKYLQEEGIFAHSVPNEAAANNQLRQMTLITMGLRSGVADMVVWWPSRDGTRIGYVEVKRESGKLSDSQRRFQARCDENHIEYIVVRSVEQVKALVEQLKKQGVRWQRFSCEDDGNKTKKED